jgi:hypothetical protein
MGRTLFTSLLLVCLLLTSTRLASASCGTDDPTGAKVLAARQAASATCSCATAADHGSYGRCVAGVANTLSSGTNPSLPPSCKGAVKRCAAHSTCGKPGAITCCFATTAGTTCKIEADAAHCTAKQGTPGTCASCCDACPAPGTPDCETATTTTTTTTTLFPTCSGWDTGPCGSCSGVNACLNDVADHPNNCSTAPCFCGGDITSNANCGSDSDCNAGAKCLFLVVQGYGEGAVCLSPCP